MSPLSSSFYSHLTSHSSLISGLSGADWSAILLLLSNSIAAIAIAATHGDAIVQNCVSNFPLFGPLVPLLSASVLSIPLLLVVLSPPPVLALSLPALIAILLIPRLITTSTTRRASVSSFSFDVLLYRVLLSFLTNLSIYGIDCPIFPRSHGKTETFGVSIMDLGIGSVAFSMGLATRSTRVKYSRLFVLVSLGLARSLVHYWIKYPVHVTEYGVHWNFFFSLSLLTAIQPWIARLSPRTASLVALLLISLHEISLHSGLQQFIFHADRFSSIIHANREGLASLPGLIALLCIARSVGSCLPSFSIFSTVWLAAAAQLVYLIAAEWAPPSRRLFNLSHCLAAAAFNITGIAMIRVLNLSSSSLISLSSVSSLPSSLLAAHSRHTLPVFMLANLSVGVLNALFNPASLSPTAQFSLLAVHSTLNFALPALIGLKAP